MKGFWWTRKRNLLATPLYVSESTARFMIVACFWGSTTCFHCNLIILCTAVFYLSRVLVEPPPSAIVWIPDVTRFPYTSSTGPFVWFFFPLIFFSFFSFFFVVPWRSLGGLLFSVSSLRSEGWRISTAKKEISPTIKMDWPVLSEKLCYEGPCIGHEVAVRK